MREKAHFTIDGSRALEEHLARICAKVRDGVRKLIPGGELEALILGGGYGRGEGGVLQTEDGERPYNDLEFYVLVRGNARGNEKKYLTELHRLAHRLEVEAGVEIEFKILSQDKLERSAPSMFFYDLAAGHRSLIGNEAFWEECPQHFQPQDIPLSEAARLLMNRCSGLLFSLERLTRPEFDAESADFVGRNQAKAQLAFGDVILAAYGQYHSSCQERSRRLEQLSAGDGCPVLPEARQYHRLGVEFKLHPHRSNGKRKELAGLQGRLMAFALELWLWLETRRLAQPFSSALDYARSPVNKCPETNPLRNALVNASTFGASGLAGSKRFRYPRERLLESLALLLWDAEQVPLIQERLNTRNAEFQPLVDAYTVLWRRFN
jgi:hypothetical protein